MVFDLDNCLASAKEPGESLFEPAFAAMRAANRGRVAEAQLAAAFADCWYHALDYVARKHHLPDDVFRAGWEAFREIMVRQPMRGYPDLEVLAELPVARFLVTSGFRRLQESKIAALGVRDLFDEVHVDAIDEPGRKGKEHLFRDIAERRGWQPAELLVVGDNADSEIAAGNALGMPTVQILRPGVAPAASAGRRIKSLAELREFAHSKKSSHQARSGATIRRPNPRRRS